MSAPAGLSGGLHLLHAPGSPAPAAERCAELRGQVDRAVAEHGAVLVRGLDVADLDAARAVGAALLDRPMAEREGFAPRVHHGGLLYSGTEWPADSPLCMHHDLSYLERVPSRLVFSCLRAPAEGGGTSVADGGEVLSLLPADLRVRALRHGWLLRRSYHPALGLSWSAAFGTSDPATAAAACAAAGVRFGWAEGGAVLRTERVRPAVLRHPGTGRRIWFNQLAFLNSATMDPAVRDYLLFEFGPDGLPFDTAFGDGSALPAELLAEIGRAYDRCARGEPWRDGDVLVLDNLRMAHARAAYRGAREVVLMMGDPVRVA